MHVIEAEVCFFIWSPSESEKRTRWRSGAMIEYREEPNSNIAEIIINGPVSKHDYDIVCDRLVALIEQKGRIRLLEDIREIGKFDLSIIPADIRFSFHHLKDMSHCAVVGELEWLTKVLDPLLRCKVRYFERDGIEAARIWLRDDPD
jgi:hypothetical protein